MPKTLVLFRHAKAADFEYGVSDFMRPLAKQGVEDAAQMAQILLQKNCIPDYIYHSAAERTTQTAQIIAKGTHKEFDILEPRIELYNCGNWELENLLLGNYSANINTLFIVAHNPSISDFANQLNKDFFQFFLPGACVALQADIDKWEEMLTAKTKVLFFEKPH